MIVSMLPLDAEVGLPLGLAKVNWPNWSGSDDCS